MPIQNGSYSFNTGTDCQIKLIGPQGEIDVSNVLNFEAKPDYRDHEIDRMDGVSLHAAIEKAWSGSFELHRSNPALDRFFSDAAAAFRSQGVYQTANLYQYVLEADGSRSIFHFTGVALKFDDPGSWGDKETRQKVSFKATSREMRA